MSEYLKKRGRAAAAGIARLTKGRGGLHGTRRGKKGYRRRPKYRKRETEIE